MCRGDVFDQMLRPNQPADAPARGVEVLACGTDREGKFGDFWREAANAGKWNVIKAVVDLEGILVGKVRGSPGELEGNCVPHRRG